MRRVLALTTIIALATAACTGSGAAKATRNSIGLPFATGGTLRVLSISDRFTPTTFDPQRAYNLEAWEILQGCLLRTLMSYNGKPADKGGSEVRPDLASGPPEISNDQLTWTFHIRQGIYYAPPIQNVQITANDFIRALLREGDPAVDSGYAFYFSVIEGFDDYEAGKASSIAGLRAPNPRTLVVHLTQPTGDLGYRLAMPAAAPIPPGVATAGVDYGRFLVSSGPYMFSGSPALDFSRPPSKRTPVSGLVPAVISPTKFVRGSATLVRNPSWDPSTDPLRPAYPARIEVDLGGRSIHSASLFRQHGFTGVIDTAYRAVEDGRDDFVIDWAPPPAVQQRYSSSAGLRSQLYVDQVATVWWIAINLAVPPFDDIHVRKAVTLAIDRDELRRRWARLTTPGPGPIPGIVADHLAPDALEGELLPDNYRPSWMPPGDGSHVRAARAEMRRSPYDTNGDGRCDARVCRHTEIVSDVAWPRPFDAVVRQGMKGIGIHVSVKRQSFASYYCRCSKSAASPGARTAMFANGWANDYPNGAGFFPTLFYGPNLSRFRSGAIDLSMLGATTEQLRAWGYPVHHVPSVDGQIDLCDAATGESQVACWAALDKHLMEKVVPWVPFLFQTVVKIVSPRVAHYSFDQATGLPALDQIALKAGST